MKGGSLGKVWPDAERAVITLDYQLRKISRICTWNAKTLYELQGTQRIGGLGLSLFNAYAPLEAKDRRIEEEKVAGFKKLSYFAFESDKHLRGSTQCWHIGNGQSRFTTGSKGQFGEEWGKPLRTQLDCVW